MVELLLAQYRNILFLPAVCAALSGADECANDAPQAAEGSRSLCAD